MPRFSNKSESKLSTCHKDIRTIFQKVVEEYDCTILEGFRTAERQAELFRQKLSKLDGYNKLSKHQGDGLESFAVDCSPYPIPENWGRDNVKEIYKFYMFAGYVKGVADSLYEQGEITHKIRWGGDWDGDKNFSDQNFDDLVHFELI